MATETTAPVVAARGGSFLVEDRAPSEVFTPEDFSDEQRMIGETAADFMQNEVQPRIGEILALKYETTRALLRKAGELGLLGVEIPEEYGGLGLDKVSRCPSCISAPRSRSGSTCPSWPAGSGSAPIRSPRPRPPPTR
jgi:alkylation response protein AidB-like acyl-CoA dehydrogenase